MPAVHPYCGPDCSLVARLLVPSSLWWHRREHLRLPLRNDVHGCCDATEKAGRVPSNGFTSVGRQYVHAYVSAGVLADARAPRSLPS